MMKKRNLRIFGTERMRKQNLMPGIKLCSVKQFVNNLFTLSALLALAVAALLLSGCAEAGGEELLTSASDETTQQVEETMEEIVLTDEEAEQDYLFLQVTSNVTVDADITPRSFYSAGIGMWQPVAISEDEKGSDELISWEELKEGQITLGEGLTIEEVDGAISEMAEAFGTVWLEAYEEAKSLSTADSTDTFHYRDYNGLAELGVYTPGARVLSDTAYRWSAPTNLYTVVEELDFLPAETVRQAAALCFKKILPDKGVSLILQSNSLEQQQLEVDYSNVTVYGANFELSEDAEEYYFLEFYETIEGIPLKRTMLRWEVKANTLAEGSYYYDAYNKGISYVSSGGTTIAFMTVTESGFELFFESCKSKEYEQLREAQEIVDINEILNSACGTLVSYGEEIMVGSVELVMARTTIEDEEGTWLVYAPFWTVDYYRNKTISGQDFCVRYQMVFDGYTGELLSDEKYG